MALGPVDVYIIGFPETNSPAVSRLPVLISSRTELSASSMSFWSSRTKSRVSSVEMADLRPPVAGIHVDPGRSAGCARQSDAEGDRGSLDNNSSALLIAFENLWAQKLTSALQAADAYVIDHVRIPPRSRAVITAWQPNLTVISPQPTSIEKGTFSEWPLVPRSSPVLLPPYPDALRTSSRNSRINRPSRRRSDAGSCPPPAPAPAAPAAPAQDDSMAQLQQSRTCTKRAC